MNSSKILPVSTLLVGLLAGGFLGRGLSPDSPGQQASETQPATKSQASQTREAHDVNLTPSLVGSKVKGAPFTGGAEELLKISGFSNFGGLASSEYFQALTSIEEHQLESLLTELCTTFQNDQRAWQVRNNIVQQWANVNPNKALEAVKNITNISFQSNLLNSVISVIASNSPEEAIALVAAEKDSSQHKNLLATVATVIAATDPQRAFELFDEFKGSSSNSPFAHHNTHYQLGQIFQKWSEKNPQQAIAAANQIKNSAARTQAQNSIAQALARKDPEQAWAYAQEIRATSGYHYGQSALAQVAAIIAQKNPTEAIAKANELPPSSQRDNMISQIASTWFQQDATAAKDWLKTLPHKEQASAINQSIWQLAQNGPKEVLALIEDLPLSSSTANVYTNLASQWVQMDPQAATKWVQELPEGKIRHDAINNIISHLSSTDPTLAASLFETQPITNNNSYQLGQIASNLALSDPDATFQWLNNLETSKQVREQILSQTISGLANSDPQIALQYLGKLEGSTRKNAVNSLIATWVQRDKDAALSWVRTLDGKEKSSALNQAAQRLAYQDHEQALAIYEELSSTLTTEELEKNYSHTLSHISGAWAQIAPAEAAEWALTQPDSKQKKDIIASVVDQWADYDDKGAAEFVLTLPEGEQRDTSIGKLVYDLRGTDPEAAFLWADSISDVNQRKNHIRNSIYSWKEASPEDARAAIINANLPQKDIDNILKNIN